MNEITVVQMKEGMRYRVTLKKMPPCDIFHLRSLFELGRLVVSRLDSLALGALVLYGDWGGNRSFTFMVRVGPSFPQEAFERHLGEYIEEVLGVEEYLPIRTKAANLLV